MARSSSMAPTGYFILLLALLAIVLFVASTNLSATGGGTATPSTNTIVGFVIILALIGIVAFRRRR